MKLKKRLAIVAYTAALLIVVPQIAGAAWLVLGGGRDYARAGFTNAVVGGRGWGNQPTASTQFVGPFQDLQLFTSLQVEADAQSPMPTSSTVTALYGHVRIPPGCSTCKETFTLMKNGAATALTCQIVNAAVACNDTAHSASYAAGDLIDVRIDTVGSGASFSSPGAITWTARVAFP